MFHDALIANESSTDRSEYADVSRRGILRSAALLGVAAATPGAALGSLHAMRTAPARLGQPSFEPGAADTRPRPVAFYPFKIGSLDAWTFCDGSAESKPVQPPFAPEAKPEEIAALLASHGQPTDRINFHFNILCVRIGKELVLFDAGYGEAGGPNGGRLPACMAAAGLKPADVTAVVFSHWHPDHICGVANKGQTALTFPNARYFINKAEHDFWTGPAATHPKAGGMIALVRDYTAAIKDKLEIVKPGDKILGNIDLVDSPGHTPGHMSAIVYDGADQVAAMADVAHNRYIMFDKPEWTVAFDVDPALAVKTRRTLFDRFAADNSKVFGYHMPWPALARITKRGDGYEWTTEDLRW
jgi:glyoxylase-like metal-dependent hydrolase (beta-lactamase superfamily II)